MLVRNFPREEELLRKSPEGVTRLVRRAYRWDMRLLLGAADLLGRPLFRFFVVADGERVVATTLLTFAPPAAYISTVMVEEEYRRRGYARRMLEACERATPRDRCQFLALDVLNDNAPARALYERLGYRPLREQSILSRTLRREDASLPAPSGLRPIRRRDGPALLALARASLPPAVAEVMPGHPGQFFLAPIVGRLMAHTSEAWVAGLPGEPSGFVRGVVDRTGSAGHLALPLFAPELPEEMVDRWLSGVVGWFSRQRVERILVEVPDHYPRSRAALERAGFAEVFRLTTMTRRLPAS
jgi:ribosomal protein S18 acetylase RimI-like enzyme